MTFAVAKAAPPIIKLTTLASALVETIQPEVTPVLSVAALGCV